MDNVDKWSKAPQSREISSTTPGDKMRIRGGLSTFAAHPESGEVKNHLLFTMPMSSSIRFLKEKSDFMVSAILSQPCITVV